MRFRSLAVLILGFAVGALVYAQDPRPPSPGPGQGQGGGRGFGRGMGMGPGSGVMGTVTEVAADHLIIRNFAGETWTVNYSVNTRFVKQPPRPAGAAGPGAQGEAAAGAEGRRGMGFGGPPTPIKPGDVKVGDTVMAGGQIDRDAKSVGAIGVMLVDPERARKMQAIEANYGKTWLMGRVTAINQTMLTVQGGPDNAPHTFVADENTSFRRRREPITLADVQVGDGVRVEGSVKDGQFVATTVNVMMAPGQGGARQEPPPQ